MFNWTKVLPNSFSLPIPFWDPLKFDQKVPHVFLLILNAHHTGKQNHLLLSYIQYGFNAYKPTSSLVLTCWVYSMQGALLSDPQTSWLFGNHRSDWQKFAGHVLYAIGERFNKPKNCGFPSVDQRLSFSDVSFVVSVFKQSGLIKFKPQPQNGSIFNFYSPIAKTKLSLISYLFHIALEKCWK